MATSARLCAACGAPLPEVGPGVTQITCPFCNVVNDLSPSGAVSVHVERAARRTPGRSGAVAVMVMVAGILVLSIGGASLGYFLRSQQRAAVNARRPAPAREAAPRLLTPADLNAQPDTGWHQLQVSEPGTGWAAFDPVAELAWAQAIGRAWRDDAVLTRVDVTRAGTTGTVNVDTGTEDEVGFRFVSPSQVADWGVRARRGEVNPSVGYELMVRISQRTVKGMVSFGKPWTQDVPPSTIDSLPLGALLQAALANRKFQESAFYDGYMIHNPREGWVWYLHGRGQLEASPRVRARDGAVYPYRK